MILHVIVSSSDSDCSGGHICDWFCNFALNNNYGFEIVITDLSQLHLPSIGTPLYAINEKDINSNVEFWSRLAEISDAYIFIIPEHPLLPHLNFISAINYLNHELSYKPAGLISYGNTQNGRRAVQCAEVLLNALKVMTIPHDVEIKNIGEQINKCGKFIPSHEQFSSAKEMIKILSCWGNGLKRVRAAHPSLNIDINLLQSSLI